MGHPFFFCWCICILVGGFIMGRIVLLGLGLPGFLCFSF